MPARLAKHQQYHHYAKALRRTGEVDAARAILEQVLAGASPHEASRLLLARIYTDDRRKSDALSAIKTILDSAVENPTGVAATVLLEAVRLLLQPALKPEARSMFHEYRRKIADRILLLASIGFGQAFETFAVVASSWAYSDSELFEELFQSLPPIPPEEQLTNEERQAWGEVFLAAAGNTKQPELSTEFGQKASHLLEVFANSSNNFARQRYVKAQLQISNFVGAAKTLEKMDSGARNEWWYYWRGKAYLGLGSYNAAVDAFDGAIKMSKDPRSAFFDSRAQAWIALSDPRCIDDYDTAIRLGADNAEYESYMREQLRLCQERFGTT